MLTFPKILLLAVVQGATELLPVSSSAHVIVVEKLMGLDPTLPAMTLLLVMLHTGTMLAVIVYFWNRWKNDFIIQTGGLVYAVKIIAAATVATGIVGLILKHIIEKIFLKGTAHAEVEMLFGNMLLISASLAAVGALILSTGFKNEATREEKPLISILAATIIGIVQGLCLPFRGFSRSGSTISAGLLMDFNKKKIEDFSFALAVVLTPPIILKEALRFLKVQHTGPHHGPSFVGLFFPSFVGMILSFISGWLALKWLSNWLEGGRWYLFGFYCLAASVVVFLLYCKGF